MSAFQFWQDSPSLAAFILPLLAILAGPALVALRMILTYRDNCRKRHTEQYEAETRRIDMERGHDRNDRFVSDQLWLPLPAFEDMLRMAARRLDHLPLA